ncbi:MAG: MBOAT family O-acyltransferase [Flavobacteriales bacterium]
MLFNSLAFLVFFPFVTVGWFLLPHKWRRWWLLGASCWFYMAFVPVYIVILGFTIVVDYVAGIWIECSEGKRRKMLLVLSILANMGVLAFFKYFNFLNESIAAVVRGMGFHYGVQDLGILLPIGLSFHTFQSLSYTIEVYRRHQKAERRFGTFALYVMFWPQLVAGPIERPGNLLNQLQKRHDFDVDRTVFGLQQMLWGFFKKLVVADRCAVLVNMAYDDPSDHSGAALLLATYLFALQIYCDFSGYTDIALGAARCMGFDLMVNFRTPYLSRNISEFWSRWHISLSSWFRDYLYIPLGGNRVVKWRWYWNLMIVFLVSGLWHGANWTYVVWGALHGAYLIMAILFGGFWAYLQKKLGIGPEKPAMRFLNVLITFHLVVLAWVFFRASNIEDAFLILRKITNLAVEGLHLNAIKQVVSSPSAVLTVVIAALFLIVDPFGDALAKRTRRIHGILPKYAWYLGLALSCLFLGQYGSTMFIYFQF